MTSPATTPESIFSTRYLWITIGSCALVFLAAFETLAVTTIMPVVSADLNGDSLYAIAFAGPLAIGVIGMVVAGNWSDRYGPTTPLYFSAVLFVAGLLVAGTADSMWTLVAGRLIQGLGGGAISVALYVVVARVYPSALLPRVFAGFAAAWVVPSLVGPFAAAVVTQLTSWHWVFLGVVGLVLIATAMIIPALRMLHGQPVGERRVPVAYARFGWSALAASAVLAINLVPDPGGHPFGLALTIGLAAGGIAVALLAVRNLAPVGMLRAARGLPTVILVRGLVSASFLGAEVYLPYLLIARYRLSPTIAGLVLTGGAIAWAATSWLQGFLGDRLSNFHAVRYGSILVLASVAAVLLVAVFHLAAVIAIFAWVVGGAGMGLIYPRLSVMTLAFSRAEDQGFNSSALTISDSLGAALSLAATGVLFAVLRPAGGSIAFVGCFALASVCAGAALLVGGRIENGGAVNGPTVPAEIPT